VSVLLSTFIGGLLGGIVAGAVISMALALFGRSVADRLLREQVAELEIRLKKSVLDFGLGRLASFLDQGERIGQIVKRVVEIIQLVFRPRAVEGPDGLDAAGLPQRQATPGASKPANVT
jgi:hypothetical protein